MKAGSINTLNLKDKNKLLQEIQGREAFTEKKS